MGWTFTDLQRNRITLDQAKAAHVRAATAYTGKTARIIMHEFHPRTWYALIGFYENEDSRTPYKVFLRTDMIDTTAGQFGYKDMTEEMGPNLDNRPSRQMAKETFKYIPRAEGYARDFRDWAGIPYIDERQTTLF